MRRWAFRPGISRSPGSAASGDPASRPAISRGRSPAPARGSRLTRPRAAGFSTGPPQTERSCTREWWMSGAPAWWCASGYSRSRAADLCGRRIHEKPDNVKRERCTTASREDVAHGSARRLRATSLLDDVLCYAIARCLLACSARGLRSRPWSRGADPRHSNRDRLRAGLPRLHDPDDLRSGAGGRLSGAVLAHVRQEASPQVARDIPRPREPRGRVAGGWRLGGGARPPRHSDDRVSPHGHAAREFQDHEHRRGSPRLSMQDRKSTRLNSSHTVISYAVFCLKKKKIIINNFIIYY